MKDVERAYLAGIIDGEGSIMLIRFHKNQQPAPCVSIASTSVELLEWIKNTTGLGKIKKKKNYNIEKHEDSFTFELRYDDAITFLDEIHTYLQIPSKKKRAQMILQDYKRLTPRNGRYSNELLTKKLEFYEAFRALREN